MFTIAAWRKKKKKKSLLERNNNNSWYARRTGLRFAFRRRRRLSEISRRPDALSPHSPAAAASKVYSEFGRGCNSRLNRIWYYAARRFIIRQRSYVRLFYY